jgi:hypothetical protein
MRLKLPTTLLDEVAWDFEGRAPFTERAGFDAALGQYRHEHGPDEPPDGDAWVSSRLVLAAPRLVLEFFADPVDQPPGTQRTLLASDSVAGFEAGELLFKVHNAVVGHVATAHHHWFEGLTLQGVDNEGVPVYSLIGGS